MSPAPRYHFLSWVRDGLASAIELGDDVASPAGPATSRLASTVSLNGQEITPPSDLSMLGPGDVTGFDRAQIVRMFPQPQISDAEPTMFPLIEFDRPDLPWLATPRRGTGDRLRPWICLVAVDLSHPEVSIEERAGVDGGVLLAPASELPDPAVLHLWAHAQLLLPSDEPIADALGPQGDRQLTVSRLVCPRLLKSFTPYRACVVPTFKATVDAILRRPRVDDLSPSWRAGERAELPVLASWQFTTGDAGGFEELVERLHGRPLADGVGQRPLDVSRNVGLPAAGANAVTKLESALRVPKRRTREPWPKDPAEPHFRDDLARLVSLSGAAAEDVDEPVVAPPLYGSAPWHATSVDPAGTHWTDELNADPRERVVGALGTTVVQREQEALMERAWRQLADHQEAERVRQRGLFARAVGTSLWSRHLAKLDDEHAFMITTAAHGRLAADATSASLRAAVHDSLLPDAADAMPYRRALRAGGQIATQIARGGGGAEALFAGRLTAVAATGLAVAYTVPDGVARMNADPRVLFDGAARDRIDAVFAGHGVESLDALSTSIAINAELAALGADELSALPVPPSLGAQLELTELPELANARLHVRAGGLAAELVTAGFALRRDDGSIFAAPRTSDGRFIPVAIDTGQISILTRREAVVVPFAQEQRAGLINAVLSSHNAIAIVGAGALAGAQAQLRPIALAQDAPVQFGAAQIEQHAQLQQIPVAAQASLSIGAIHLSDELVAQARPVDQGGVRVALQTFAADRSVSIAATPGTKLASLATIVDLVGRDLVAGAAGHAATTLGPWRDAVAPVRPAFDVARQAAAARAQLHPARAVERYLRHRLGLDPARVLVTPLWTPTFPDPMWKPLSAISNDWILAGMDRIPPNTVTLAESNNRFIEAYLVGLNHEIGREMVWREFPTDRRGTCFQSFWGLTMPNPQAPPATRLVAEIEQLAAEAWRDGPLGTHKPAAAGVRDQLVLMIRGDLLRRYPGTIVFAVPAVGLLPGGRPDFASADVKQPVFGGALGDEYRFLGFDLTPEQALAQGWWFVFAEQPTEPRFGLDTTTGDWGDAKPYVAPRPAGATDEILRAAAWNNANWSNAVKHADFEPGRHAPARAPNLRLRGADAALDPAVWGTHAADIARICFQQPVRASVSAASMLSAEAAAPSASQLLGELRDRQLRALNRNLDG